MIFFIAVITRDFPWATYLTNTILVLISIIVFFLIRLTQLGCTDSGSWDRVF